MSPVDVYDIVQEEAQRIESEMFEAQMTRSDLLLRVALIEQYMHCGSSRSSRRSGRDVFQRRWRT